MLHMNRIIFSLLISSLFLAQSLSAPAESLSSRSTIASTANIIIQQSDNFAVEEAEESQARRMKRRDGDGTSLPATQETEKPTGTTADSVIKHTIDDVPETKADAHLAGDTANQMKKRDTEDPSKARRDLMTEEDQVREQSVTGAEKEMDDEKSVKATSNY